MAGASEALKAKGQMQAGLNAVIATMAEGWRGIAMVLVASIAAAFLFYPGAAALATAWLQPEYSHGPLIPLISGYLLLRQMKSVPVHVGPIKDRGPGLLVVGLAMILGAGGSILGIEKIAAIGIIVWVYGMLLVSFGWERGKQFWPPVLHLAFMLPLPTVVYWKTSLALQFVSSEIGVGFIRLMDIPVFLEGNVIDLGTYQLLVAEACSGLRYLFPIMSFTYIFAVLYKGSIWHKSALLMAAIPIAVLMNSLRVGVIGVMVNYYGIEHAEGFMHLFEGWVVFLLCILAMIGLSKLMQMVGRDHRSLAEALDVDTDGIGTQLARVGDVRASGAMIGGALAIGMGAVLATTLQPSAGERIIREPLLLFPMKLGEWSSYARNTLDDHVAGVLAADDYLSAYFHSKEHDAPVDLFIAFYEDQSNGGIHSPEACIPAGGWEMSDIQHTEVTVETVNGPETVPVNRAVIQNGVQKALVYYWFDQGGTRLTSTYAAKFYQLQQAYETGRTDGALVRFITPLEHGEPEEAGDARLQSMVAETLPLLPQYISHNPRSDI
ncbi:MAG: VPLPA-CTERM-specific exosortase XrtD [Pseudomonadota bacterium]